MFGFLRRGKKNKSSDKPPSSSSSSSSGSGSVVQALAEKKNNNTSLHNASSGSGGGGLSLPSQRGSSASKSHENTSKNEKENNHGASNNGEKKRFLSRVMSRGGADKEPAITFKEGECACAVDKDGDLKKKALDAFCKQNRFKQWGTNFVVIGTLGKQQIGKSSFLNACFGSEFQVRSGLRKELTTEGVWLSAVQDKDTAKRALVLDVEGCDGKERGSDKLMERRLGLLSLVVCNVLVIHVPEVDVGCEDAANRTLLRIIIEEKLANFPSTRKIILRFVIRDFLAQANDLAALKTDMVAMFEGVWGEARKPSRYANTKWQEVFEVGVSAFPDLRTSKDTEDCQELMKQFRAELLGGAGSGVSPICATPVSAFSDWLASVWTKGKEDGALDLPGTIALFATARGHRAARRALADFDAAWSAAGKELEKSDATKYGDFTTSLLDVHLQSFDTQAGELGLGTDDYDEVLKTHRGELRERILSRLRDAYLEKASALKLAALSAFDEHVSAYNAKKHGDIGEYLARGESRCYNGLRADLSSATVADENWDENPQVKAIAESLAQEMTVIKTIESLRMSSVEEDGNRV